MRLNYVIIFVQDMARSVVFYRDVLGFPLKYETPQWTEFATGGTTVALHLSEGSSPANTIAHDEAAGRCRPGLQVPDLEAFHRRMIENNVHCVEEPATVFGAKLAQYADPDGLVISVGEEQ